MRVHLKGRRSRLPVCFIAGKSYMGVYKLSADVTKVTCIHCLSRWAFPQVISPTLWDVVPRRATA